jgi:peroxiredoxin
MKQIMLFITVALLAGCFGAEPQKTGKEGKSLPDFSLLLLDSTTKLNSRDIPSGKPFVLFYYSPFCPYCNAQTKKIVEDEDMLKNIHFYFISGYPLAQLKKFDEKYQLSKLSNITMALDSANFISDYFEIPGFPFFSIYGKDKTLNKAFLGKMYSRQIIAAAEK